MRVGHHSPSLLVRKSATKFAFKRSILRSLRGQRTLESMHFPISSLLRVASSVLNKPCNLCFVILTWFRLELEFTLGTHNKKPISLERSVLTRRRSLTSFPLISTSPSALARCSASLPARSSCSVATLKGDAVVENTTECVTNKSIKLTLNTTDVNIRQKPSFTSLMQNTLTQKKEECATVRTWFFACCTDRLYTSASPRAACSCASSTDTRAACSPDPASSRRFRSPAISLV